MQKIEDVEDLNNTRGTNLSPGAGGAPSEDQVNRKAEQALRSIKRLENALDLLKSTTINAQMKKLEDTMDKRVKDQLGLLKAGVDKKLKVVKDLPSPKDLEKKFKSSKDENEKKLKEVSKTIKDVNKEIVSLKNTMEKVNILVAQQQTTAVQSVIGQTSRMSSNPKEIQTPCLPENTSQTQNQSQVNNSMFKESGENGDNSSVVQH